MPAFNTFTYSHDQDSYGWSNVTNEFGSKKGLTAAGALYSAPINHSWPLDAPLVLKLDHKQPAYPSRPHETEWSKYVSITSPKLSAFWGRPVNVSAWVLLPAGFDSHPHARYPLILNAGHYSHQRMRGWSEQPPATVTLPEPLQGDPDDCYYCSSGGGSCPDCAFHDDFKQMYAYHFYSNWTSLDKSSAFHRNRVLLVRIQTPNPFFDDSYSVNSDNLGPYGDAITYELLPEIEKRYRGLGAWARGTYGGSTGGWEAIAAQVLYPKEYNGCIACAADPIDFRALSPGVDIYAKNARAFQGASAMSTQVTGYARTFKGEVLASLADGWKLEQALGGWRSGGQLSIWMAVYGPKGDDGLPLPLWDADGLIDPKVAAYWEKLDLSKVLDKEWPKSSKDLIGKIKVFTGAMDAYYLNLAAYRMEERVRKLEPQAEAEFRYGGSNGRGYSHAWKGDNTTSAEVGDLTMHERFIPMLVQGFVDRAPKGADVSSWRY